MFWRVVNWIARLTAIAAIVPILMILVGEPGTGPAGLRGWVLPGAISDRIFSRIYTWLAMARFRRVLELGLYDRKPSGNRKNLASGSLHHLVSVKHPRNYVCNCRANVAV
jgi:hypothetical protein